MGYKVLVMRKLSTNELSNYKLYYDFRLIFRRFSGHPPAFRTFFKPAALNKKYIAGSSRPLTVFANYFKTYVAVFHN